MNSSCYKQQHISSKTRSTMLLSLEEYTDMGGENEAEHDTNGYEEMPDNNHIAAQPTETRDFPECSKPAQIAGSSTANTLTQKDLGLHQPGVNNNSAIRENPHLDSIVLPDVPDLGSRYIRYTNTYSSLRTALLDDELASSTVLRGTKCSFIERTANNILMSMDKRVLHGLVRGNLPILYRNDGIVKQIINRLTPATLVMRETEQPTIYINYIVDRHGYGLNAVERTLLIQRLRQYINKVDHDFATQVDTYIDISKWSFLQSHRGDRKYLGDGETEKDRRDIVERFCSNLQNNTLKLGPHCHLYPFREVGYTDNSMVRLEQHRKHNSSNFLMNLIQAICGVEFVSKFTLDQYVVARLWEAEQATVGEIIVTRIADGYVDSGVGMSFWSAGRNNTSAWNFSSGDLSELAYVIWTETPIQYNQAWELAKLREIRDRYVRDAEKKRGEGDRIALLRFKYIVTFAKLAAVAMEEDVFNQEHGLSDDLKVVPGKYKYREDYAPIADCDESSVADTARGDGHEEFGAQ